MSDTFSMWDEPTEQITAQREADHLALAEAAAEPLWPYLSQAKTQSEFEGRLALAGESLRRMTAAVVDDAEEHLPVVRQRLAERHTALRMETALAQTLAGAQKAAVEDRAGLQVKDAEGTVWVSDGWGAAEQDQATGEWIGIPDSIRLYDIENVLRRKTITKSDIESGKYTVVHVPKGRDRKAQKIAGYAIVAPGSSTPLWGMVYDTEEGARAHHDAIKDRTDDMVPRGIKDYTVKQVSAPPNRTLDKGAPHNNRFQPYFGAKTAGWVNKARAVVQSQGYLTVDGVLLDLTTAHMLMQVHDALGEDNRAKFAAMPLTKAVEVGWALVNKTKTSAQVGTDSEYIRTDAEGNEIGRAVVAEDRKGHSAKCPKCGAQLSSVVQYGDSLHATCDACGWKGSKKRKTSAGEGYSTCPTCRGSGAHPWDFSRKCPKCRGTGIKRPTKKKHREPDLDDILGARTAETHAPYRIEQDGEKWKVVNDLGETKGTHDSEEQAREQQKALYANVPGSSEQAEKKQSAVQALLSEAYAPRQDGPSSRPTVQTPDYLCEDCGRPVAHHEAFLRGDAMADRPKAYCRHCAWRKGWLTSEPRYHGSRKTAAGPIRWQVDTHFTAPYLKGKAANGDNYEVYENPNSNPTPCSWVNYGPELDGDTAPLNGPYKGVGRGFATMQEAMRAAEQDAAGTTASRHHGYGREDWDEIAEDDGAYDLGAEHSRQGLSPQVEDPDSDFATAYMQGYHGSRMAARDYCVKCGEDIVRGSDGGWTHKGDQWNSAEVLNGDHEVEAIEDYGKEGSRRFAYVSRTAAEDLNAYDQGYHDGYMDGSRGGRGGFALQNTGWGSEADYAEGYYKGFDAAVYSEDNMLPVIGRTAAPNWGAEWYIPEPDGKKKCPGSGKFVEDTEGHMICPECLQQVHVTNDKIQNHKAGSRVEALLASVTEQDWLEIEGGRRTAEVMPPGSVRITPKPEKGRIDVVQVWGPTSAVTVWSGGDPEEARRQAEQAIAKGKREWPEEAAGAKVYDQTKQASRDIGRVRQAVNTDEYGSARYSDDPTATMPKEPEWINDAWGAPNPPIPLHDRDRENPFSKDTLERVKRQRAEATRREAVDFKEWEQNSDFDPESAGSMPRTTRPRVMPEEHRSPQRNQPPAAQDSTSLPDADIEGFSTQTPEPAQPTPEQKTTARVARLTRRVLADNPTMDRAEAHRLAVETVSRYPEMVSA